MSGGLAARVAEFETGFVERARAETDAVGAEAILSGRRASAGMSAVLGGWWCRPGEETAVRVLPNPWDDRDAVALYDEYSFQLARGYARALGRALEVRFETGHPSAYWELLLEPWLHLTLSQLLDRALFVRAAHELAPAAPFVVEGALAVPATMWETTNAQLTDRWNALLVGELARAAGHSTTMASHSVDGVGTAEPVPRASPEPAAIGALRALARRLTLGAPQARRLALLGAHGLRLREIVALNRALGGVRPARGSARVEPYEPAPDESSARAQLGRATREGVATGLPIEVLLPRLLPRSLLEDYRSLVAQSEAQFGPSCAILDGSYSFMDAENEFVARSKAAGHRIAEIQHGGASLSLRSHPHSRFVAGPDSHFDRFFAWGPAEGGETLPHPRVEELRDTHRGGDSVVIVEMLLPPQNQLLRFETMPLANQVYTELDRLATFVEAVGPARAHLVLKRFPGLVAAAERPDVLAGLPVAESRRRRTAVAWMQASRVAVLAYPDTPFIEAMLIGVPTIGLWGTNLWNWKDDAKGPFEALEAAGVVFSDPHAAAVTLGEVYERAGEWWAQPAIQDARQLFLDRFAAGGDWLPAWTSALRGLTETGR